MVQILLKIIFAFMLVANARRTKLQAGPTGIGPPLQIKREVVYRIRADCLTTSGSGVAGAFALTEEHFVEEIAGIMWRKRRLGLAEAAAHRRGLEGTLESYHRTVKVALVHLGTSVHLALSN